MSLPYDQAPSLLEEAKLAVSMRHANVVRAIHYHQPGFSPNNTSNQSTSRSIVDTAYGGMLQLASKCSQAGSSFAPSSMSPNTANSGGGSSSHSQDQLEERNDYYVDIWLVSEFCDRGTLTRAIFDDELKIKNSPLPNMVSVPTAKQLHDQKSQFDSVRVGHLGTPCVAHCTALLSTSFCQPVHTPSSIPLFWMFRSMLYFCVPEMLHEAWHTSMPGMFYMATSR